MSRLTRLLIKFPCYSVRFSHSPSPLSKVPPTLGYFEHTMALREEFLSNFENVVKPLLQVSDLRLNSVTARLNELLQYNTHAGKLNRGCAVVHTTRLLGSDEILQATVMGWCIEILQAFLLVADDIMDDSEMRRGQPCWYKRPGVGLTAINDSLMLQSAVYELLRLHSSDKPYYVKCLQLFLDVCRRTEFGQALDLESETLPLTSYNMDRYDSIVEYKTAYYSFYLPVVLALHIAGRDSPQELESARRILLRIGHYFQVQDDYLDCYGDPSVIGKIGTDIQEKKCSWLFLTASAIASPEQKELLFGNYGKSDEASVAAVKALYNTLNIRQCYLDYSVKTYREICEIIEKDKSGLPSEIFSDFLDMIHKRSK